ncbi:MAG: uL15 family ribosomal protein [Patescibacteria group bacterium]
MQLHSVKTANPRKKAVRIGRGGKRGSFSGRGIKGQKARAGRRIRPEMRDVIMKIPKRRGHAVYFIPRMRISIKLSAIAKKFGKGETITPKELYKRDLIKRIGGKIPAIKIVGPGTISAFTIKGCEISANLQK